MSDKEVVHLALYACLFAESLKSCLTDFTDIAWRVRPRAKKTQITSGYRQNHHFPIKYADRLRPLPSSLL